MYIVDVKILLKMKKNLETLIHRVFSQDVGMEFGFEKCSMLIIEEKKRETSEGIEQLNQESIRTLREKENNKYLGILEANTIKQTDKRKSKKRVH